MQYTFAAAGLVFLSLVLVSTILDFVLNGNVFRTILTFVRLVNYFSGEWTVGDRFIHRLEPRE